MIQVENLNEIEKKVFESIKDVEDPELNLALADLGLIYEIKEYEPNKVSIDMTLTSMGCPAGPYLKSEVLSQAMKTEGVEDVKVNIVWTPKWDPRTMATEDVRMILGILD